jgi:hypothetical protein
MISHFGIESMLTDASMARVYGTVPQATDRARVCRKGASGSFQPIIHAGTLLAATLRATMRTHPPPSQDPRARHKIHSVARASAGSFNPASMRSRTAYGCPRSAARPHRTLQIPNAIGL